MMDLPLHAQLTGFQMVGAIYPKLPIYEKRRFKVFGWSAERMHSHWSILSRSKMSKWKYIDMSHLAHGFPQKLSLDLLCVEEDEILDFRIDYYIILWCKISGTYLPRWGVITLNEVKFCPFDVACGFESCRQESQSHRMKGTTIAPTNNPKSSCDMLYFQFPTP